MDQTVPEDQPAGHFISLDKPLVFFDLETTGLSVTYDRIVEIFAIKYLPDGSQLELHYFLNPTIPIPAEASGVHGITDEQVKDCPRFCDVAGDIHEFFQGCDVSGYNARDYDIPLLMEEFHRCKLYPLTAKGTRVVDPKAIFFQKEPRTLSKAVEFYCQGSHEEAHSAKADVLATINVLKHQLLRYADLEPNTHFLHDYTGKGECLDFKGYFIRDSEGEIVFNFGKHKGKRAIDNLNYVKWMLEEMKDLPVDSRTIAERVQKSKETMDQITRWLDRQKVTRDVTKASALYASVKFTQSIAPYSINEQGNALIVTDSSSPTNPFYLKNQEDRRLLIKVLERCFTNLGETIVGKGTESSVPGETAAS